MEISASCQRPKSSITVEMYGHQQPLGAVGISLWFPRAVSRHGKVHKRSSQAIVQLSHVTFKMVKCPENTLIVTRDIQVHN
jgi:hypothetical protein